MNTNEEPEIIGVVALIVKDRKILCVQRVGPMWEDMLSLPGGILETGEVDIDGLIREVEEETGYKILVENKDPVLVSEIIYNGKPAIYKVFRSKIVGGFAKLQKEEVKDMLWVNPNKYLESLLQHGFPQSSIVEIREMLSKIKLI